MGKLTQSFSSNQTILTDYMKKIFTQNPHFQYRHDFTNCNHCLDNLQMIIDGEATEEEERFFKEHIDECEPCFKSYHLDKSVKLLLRSKISHRPIPADLIEKIKTKLSQKA